MQEKNLTLIAAICIILGVIIITSATIEASAVKINKPLDIQIYFCPKDNCKDILINAMQNASNIQCAFYDLDIPELQDLLKQKQALLITDIENKVSNSVTNKGYQLMHNKFCILDDKTLITGSTNPTIRGTTQNNNNLIIINSKELADNYKKEFSELYKGTFGSGEKTKNKKFEFINSSIENYFCPEDLCAQKIISHLNKAEKSIYFMTFSFTDYNIAQALINKKDIEIWGIFEKSKQSKYTQFYNLQKNNITVNFDKNKATMHHKVFIIDNQTVILGSMNPTEAGNEKNDENILIIQNKNIANKFTEEFNSLL